MTSDGRALTERTTRCAGKLVEQLVTLPAADLRPHLRLVESTVARSKIFFRIDLPALRNRIALLDLGADELSEELNNSIGQLSENPQDATAVHRGLHALEALRRYHPQQLDLAKALDTEPPDHGHRAVSFQLTLQSLTQLEDVHTYHVLARHVIDSREPIHTAAVEALVRIGTPEAAVALVNQFHAAAPEVRPWIARGLQRMRAPGLSDAIAMLRSHTSDSSLWLMLLIAETRQLDGEKIERLAQDVARLTTISQPLFDALQVFVEVLESHPSFDSFGVSIMEYVIRGTAERVRALRKQHDRVRREQRRFRGRVAQSAMKNYKLRNKK
jgi:hypothetical protein